MRFCLYRNRFVLVNGTHQAWGNVTVIELRAAKTFKFGEKSYDLLLD